MSIDKTNKLTKAMQLRTYVEANSKTEIKFNWSI